MVFQPRPVFPPSSIPAKHHGNKFISHWCNQENRVSSPPHSHPPAHRSEGYLIDNSISHPASSLFFFCWPSVTVVGAPALNSAWRLYVGRSAAEYTRSLIALACGVVVPTTRVKPKGLETIIPPPTPTKCSASLKEKHAIVYTFNLTAVAQRFCL